MDLRIAAVVLENAAVPRLAQNLRDFSECPAGPLWTGPCNEKPPDIRPWACVIPRFRLSASPPRPASSQRLDRLAHAVEVGLSGSSAVRPAGPRPVTLLHVRLAMPACAEVGAGFSFQHPLAVLDRLGELADTEEDESPAVCTPPRSRGLPDSAPEANQQRIGSLPRCGQPDPGAAAHRCCSEGGGAGAATRSDHMASESSAARPVFVRAACRPGRRLTVVERTCRQRKHRRLPVWECVARGRRWSVSLYRPGSAAGLSSPAWSGGGSLGGSPRPPFGKVW